jgi:predicted branched-subunit amino acid permease
MPYLGWSLGTLLGGLLGNVLPEMVMNALCLAIYGMFLAIVAPVAKAERPVLIVVAAAVALHCLFYYTPYLRDIPSGITISLCAVAAALVGALLFPIADDQEEEVSAE